MNKMFLFVFVILIKTLPAAAQAPLISYPESQEYTTNTNIAPLTPSNAGGAVPTTPYANVTTFAGSGLPGINNGTGTAASFHFPKTLACDAAGNVYVADYQGHIIRKVSPAGVVTTLAGTGAIGTTDGPATSATFKYPVGIAVDASGNVYVTDQSNRIRKISPQGMVSTHAGSGAFGTTDGPALLATFNSPTGLAVDAAGNVFVADEGNHLLRKISASGVVSTLFSGSGSDFSTPAGLAVDASGTLYVADLSRKIRKITPDGDVTTVAGSGNYGNSDGQGTLASFYSPRGITVDADGNIYVADSYNNNIRMITPGGMVTTIAGTFTYGFKNGVGTASLFYTPSAIALDNNGNAYVADEYNHRIRKIALTGYRITPALPSGLIFDGATGTISGSATTISSPTTYTVTATNASGTAKAEVSISVVFPPAPPTISALTATSARIGSTILITGTNLLGVSGVTVGGVEAKSFSSLSATKLGIVVPKGAVSGSVTVSNAYGSSTVSGFTLLAAPAISYSVPQTLYIGYPFIPVVPQNTGGAVPTTKLGEISTFAGSGISGFADSSATQAKFYKPIGLSVDAGGNVLVSDQVNNRIRKISPEGIVSTFAGTGSNGSSTDGIGTTATFNVPSGVAVDASGNVYVADKYAHKIRKITIEGVVSTVAGSGLQGSADGPGESATFNFPEGLTTDLSGNVYVADAGNNLIRKITLQGIVSTIAGNKGFQSGDDGIGTSASFYMPSGITADPHGNLFVTDRRNHKIRKITALGEVSTFAGSGHSGSEDGPDTSASFTDPNGIAVDPATGHLLVTEATTHALRFVSPSGYVFTLINETENPTTLAYPEGVVFDGRGNAYIADANHSVVKKVNLTGYTISPSLPEGLIFDSKTGILNGSPTAKNPLKEYTITAFNSGGSSMANFNLAVADPPPPTITALSLSSAITGTTITITGTFFLGATGVTFGGTPAQSFQVDSPTSITAVVGAGSSGEVAVSTAYGTGTMPGFVFVFMLPPNTLKVITQSLTCRGLANGSIKVMSSVANNQYTAVVSKDGTTISTSNFTDSTAIPNLTAGSYSVCITLGTQPGFKQCFTVIVEEPKDISVYTAAVKNNEIVLQLDGAHNYHLTLNGRNYSTSESQITLPLKPGDNRILVSSDLLCQGTIERNINISETPVIYPNPFENTLNVILNNEVHTSTLVSVFTQDGKKLFARSYKNQEAISLDLSLLNPGAYLLKLSTDITDSVHRIIKK
jgi:sugar lactone lactonase YvrE